MLNLKIIIGSTRPGRAADHVAPRIVDRAKEHPAFSVEVLDLRDWPLPLFSETFQTVGDPRNPTYSDPIIKRWNQRIAEGDAYLFITPEYNHSVPGVLKNAIDSVFASFGFRNKAAAFVGYSGGIAAGVRAIEHLAHIGIEAEMVPLRSTVLIPMVGGALDENGVHEVLKKASLEDLAALWDGVAFDESPYWLDPARVMKALGDLAGKDGAIPAGLPASLAARMHSGLGQCGIQSEHQVQDLPADLGCEGIIDAVVLSCGQVNLGGEMIVRQ